MDKREFLKASGVLAAGSMLSHVLPGQEPAGPRENWAGNITYSTDRLLTPGSLEEVQQAVKTTAKMRALGSRHSFNTIADSRSAQISLKRLDQMTIDDKAKTVTVGAGVPYGKLAPYIDARGYSLQNLASLPHISVAGAIATATHGSGLANRNLASAVAALEFVTANGEVATLSRERW
jgi:xylitol oxidase